MSEKTNIVGYLQHITIDGDTFDSMALEAYNDEMQASLIIQANPDLCDVLIFGAGEKIRIPVIDRVETPDTLPPWRRVT